MGTRNPKVPRRSVRKDGLEEGRKGNLERKKKSPGRLNGGRRPRGQKAQESRMIPLRSKPSGSNEGSGFSGESKPLKRRYEAHAVS